MKKGTVFGILLAAAMIIGLGAFAIYLTVHFKDDLSAERADTAAEQAESAVLALYTPETPETQTERAAAETEAPAPEYIWVGDSRTVAMSKAMANADIYIGASGEGYNWLSETGLPLLRDAIEEYPDLPVIFNFGVNDYDNLSNYLALYRSLMTEYADTRFYYLAVYPIDPEVCVNITNEEITDFNNHLKELSPETYMDSYTFLTENEILTIDGIHYSEEDSRKLYDFAVEQIAKIEAGN